MRSPWLSVAFTEQDPQGSAQMEKQISKLTPDIWMIDLDIRAEDTSVGVVSTTADSLVTSGTSADLGTTTASSVEVIRATPRNAFSERIDEVTGNWRTEERLRLATERERDEARAELARLRAGQSSNGTGPSTTVVSSDKLVTLPDGTKIDEAVFNMAVGVARNQTQADAARNEFNQQCTDVHTKGMAEYKDAFSTDMTTLGQLGGVQVPVMQAMIETGNAHKILHDLAQNPNEAMRVLRLPITKAIVEITKMSLKPAANADSNAPRPIDPLRPGGSIDPGAGLDNPTLSMEEFARRRQEQRQAREKSGRRH